MNKFILLSVLATVVLAQYSNVADIAFGKGVYYGDYANIKANDAKDFAEVGKILETQLAAPTTPQAAPYGEQLDDPSSLDARHGLLHLLHASLHNDRKPVALPNGQLINELHPAVRVAISRITKVRRIPHHGGEIVRRVNTDEVLTAIGTTSDMIWLQIGNDEFVLTKDCHLNEQKEKHKNVLANEKNIIALTPELPVHVKEEVTVRKLPSVNGKAVGLLKTGDLITAIGATADYSWLQIGKKQFIPTAFAQLGDPSTPLVPPVTIHISADFAEVRDIPSYEGSVVTKINKGDVLQAIGVSSDLKWIKVAKNNYVASVHTKVGLPRPSSVRFPEPIAVVLTEDTNVVKNPNEPQMSVRQLRKDDQVLAIGTTEDFRWIELGRKQFISATSCVLASPPMSPIPLEQHIFIKVGTDTPVRHIPNNNGRVMSIVKKGDKLEAIGVSPDFAWLQLGEHMFVPLANVFIAKPDPVMNPVVPPMLITLRKDARVYKRPGDDEKYIKTLPIGNTVHGIAASPDLEWIKIGAKEYIKADTAKLLELPEISPLEPAVEVVVIRDTKIFKAPRVDGIVMKRIKRGETVKAEATTADLKWLVLNENEYILTDDVAHIASTSKLSPPVKVVVGSSIKARNVPAFSGRAVKPLQQGEVVEALEVTHDYKWFKIGHGIYVPAAACVLHETEGKNLLVVLKARNSPLPQDPNALAHPAIRAAAPPTTTSLISQTKQQTEAEKIQRLKQQVKQQQPVSMQPVETISNIRVVIDAPVFSKPTTYAKHVKDLPKGTFVKATAIDAGLNWIQIGAEEFIQIDHTNSSNIKH